MDFTTLKTIMKHENSKKNEIERLGNKLSLQTLYPKK